MRRINCQQYAVSGHKTSFESWETGRAVARIPRFVELVLLVKVVSETCDVVDVCLLQPIADGTAR